MREWLPNWDRERAWYEKYVLKPLLPFPFLPKIKRQSNLLQTQNLLLTNNFSLFTFTAMATAVATQRRNLLLAVTKESTTGRTYIVTGANSGLGFEAAKHLVSLGASKVILAVRNIASGLEAKTAIETSTKTTNIAEVWELDLASYDSVKKFAKKAEEGLERIDALIENAGVAGNQQGFVEGHLLNVTVNVLSTLLLGVLLLPKMSEGAKKYGIVPHVVFVTSSTAFDMRGSWEGMKDNPIKKIDKVENLMMTYV
jgi:hypothetical protein